MKAIHLAAMLGVLLLAGSGSAPAGEPSSPVHQPLRPLGECMRAGRIKDWGVVDAHRVVVHTWDGRYYDIGLQDSCPTMARRAFLTATEGWHAPMPDGRICGEMGEALLPHGFRPDRLTDHPCRIANLQRIDRKTFDTIFRMTPVEARHFLDGNALDGGAGPAAKPAKTAAAGEMAKR
jgi:hypothetical protein